MKITKDEIVENYNKLDKIHQENLEDYGVKFPSLYWGDNYSKSALVLIYLFINKGKIVSKKELTSFVRRHHPETNDVQQARHLGQQKGWYIISGTRNDREAKNRGLKSGEYMLYSLEKPYPKFTGSRRNVELDEEKSWDDIKEYYNYRCATCGSKEGKTHLHYPGVITRLQKGHMNPRKKLYSDNTIPQCNKCNRADRNYFVYNDKGRVVEIADPRFVLRSTEKVKSRMFELLKEDLGK